MRAQGFGDYPVIYRPAKDAKDLRSVLFNWTWYMGMLRGVDEHELIASLEYQGKGTIQVDGQPCTLTKYRVSTSYQAPGQRVQYTCTRSNGQTYSNVEVVSGQYAWNEDIAGAEIIPGKGKATPMPGAVEERLIRLWASPQGAPKAAIAGIGPAATPGANPAALLKDGVDKAGETSLSWDAGKPVVTYPIPGVPGAIATATLNDKYMAERVVVKQGSKTTEFTYGDYQDWNNPLNKVDALYAGKIMERRNGAAVRDLTTVQTETGSVYVVLPVPASVQAAIHVAAKPAPAPAKIGSFRGNTPVGKRASGLFGQLEFERHELALRESPVQSHAAGGMFPGTQSDHGFRIRSAFAVGAESSNVQTRVLGQGPGARYVDEQGRPRDDVPAARKSAAGPAPAHRSIGERYYLLLRPIRRWRRRK